MSEAQNQLAAVQSVCAQEGAYPSVSRSDEKNGFRCSPFLRPMPQIWSAEEEAESCRVSIGEKLARLVVLWR